jgi:hypothetical protein
MAFDLQLERLAILLDAGCSGAEARHYKKKGVLNTVFPRTRSRDRVRKVIVRKQ